MIGCSEYISYKLQTQVMTTYRQQWQACRMLRMRLELKYPQLLEFKQSVL